MKQIRKSYLQDAVNTINRELGAPTERYTLAGYNKRGIKANIGYYFLNWDYNKPELRCITGEDHESKCILERAATKRDMYNQLHALLTGVRISRQ